MIAERSVGEEVCPNELGNELGRELSHDAGTMTRVAIAGLGAVGRVVARRLADGIPGLTLACAAARDRAKAQAWLDAQKIAAPLVDLDALPEHADIAVECAPAAVIED